MLLTGVRYSSRAGRPLRRHNHQPAAGPADRLPVQPTPLRPPPHHQGDPGGRGQSAATGHPGEGRQVSDPAGGCIPTTAPGLSFQVLRAPGVG